MDIIEIIIIGGIIVPKIATKEPKIHILYPIIIEAFTGKGPGAD